MPQLSQVASSRQRVGEKFLETDTPARVFERKWCAELLTHVLRGLGALVRPLGNFSPLARLAVSHLSPPSGRHRLAAASLACAIAMTAGMAILVGSFERTMQQWIATSFQADLYLSSAGAQSASSQNRIRPETWHRLANDPAVADSNVLHSADVLFPGGTAMVLGVNSQFDRAQGTVAWLGDAPTHWLNDGDFAFVSEAFIERFGIGRGDILQKLFGDSNACLIVRV